VESTIVDSVQPTLGPIVIPADAREEAVLVSERDIESVDTVIFSAHDELGEHDRCFAMECGVTDVVLPRSAMGSVEDKVTRLLVIRGRRCNRGHIGPVARLCHGKASRSLEGHDAWQVLQVMLLGSQVHNGCTKETPLNPRLNLERGISEN